MVGGGVIGCAIAERLARDGHRVVLFERDRLGAHASGAAAGLLNPYSQAESEDAFFEMARESLAAYPELAARLEAATGLAVEFRSQESIRIAFDDAEREVLFDRVRWQTAIGIRCQAHSPVEMRRLEPELSEVAGGAVFPEAQITPIRLVRALGAAAAKTGAVIREGSPVLGLVENGGRVEGVRLLGEVVPADHVVLAAGPWTPEVARSAGVEVPVRPRRGQLVALRPSRRLIDRIVTYGRLYLVPKPDGTIVCGSTEEEAGFDAAVTAEGAASLLTQAIRALPGLGRSTIERLWAGLRPAPPGELPLMGPVEGHPGLLLATGHNRNGILLAPATAERISRVIG